MDRTGHVVAMWVFLVFAIVFTLATTPVFGYWAFFAYVPWGVTILTLVYRLTTDQ